MQVDLERTHASVPELSEGHTVVMYPDDHSPFLGQVQRRVPICKCGYMSQWV